MKHITLDVSDETFEAIQELSAITMPDTEQDRIAKLLAEGLRTYEWVIYHQLNGGKLVVLKPSDSDHLPGQRFEEAGNYINPLFPEEKKPMLENYFRKATDGRP